MLHTIRYKKIIVPGEGGAWSIVRSRSTRSNT